MPPIIALAWGLVVALKTVASFFWETLPNLIVMQIAQPLKGVLEMPNVVDAVVFGYLPQKPVVVEVLNAVEYMGLCPCL